MAREQSRHPKVSDAQLRELEQMALQGPRERLQVLVEDAL
jgi:hypothetical protein